MLGCKKQKIMARVTNTKIKHGTGGKGRQEECKC
jgi:hypothetical protein